ncbi:hypothetical protein N7492_006116 [Penicillium capsulatum]|uniref:DUF6536 domain-containing protein n=1 Tax=Penicillium capsulatum TaxID=69766 RepID=A0A9W9LMD6_9EURO|nr:hypothetical protein N7492_006116 [Penicillium capsulatum]KAJ6108766.1 hypothetical protein N7512_008603 [Penicillium capsulatum]
MKTLNLDRIRAFFSHWGDREDRDGSELTVLMDRSSLTNEASSTSLGREDQGNRSAPSLEEHANERTDQAETTNGRSWIDGVYLCAKATTILLLINLVLFAVAAGMSRKYPENTGFLSWAVIYKGSCTSSEMWGVVLHLVINILSTGILAASNNCMQTLVAPSRQEIDKSHARHQWLDIGRASVRNLFAISWYRLALWTILMITATPFHLLYNSVVIQSLSLTEFALVAGPKDLSAENVLNLTTPALEKCFGTSPAHDANNLNWHEFSQDIASGNYERLTYHQSNDIQGSPVSLQTKALVARVQNLAVEDGGDRSILRNGLLYTQPRVVSHMGFWSHSGIWAIPFANETHGPDEPHVTCGNDPFDFDHENVEKGLRYYPIQDCLAIKAPGNCRLLYSPPLCIVVALTLLVKVIVIFLAARVSHTRSTPLLTIGDAVASFMTRPDRTTQRLCWISYADVRSGSWKDSNLVIENPRGDDSPGKVIYRRLSPPRRWIKAPSLVQWLATFMIAFACIAIAVTFMYVPKNAPLPNQIFESYSIFGQDWGPLSSAVLANTPQLVITVNYYYFNNVLTSMLAVAEYSSYGNKRRPLRVTWPVKDSQQRSTYWLNIPYLYSVPTLLVYSTLHWMISQSLFYYHSVSYDVRGRPDTSSEVSALASAPIPLGISIALGALMICVLLGVSFRKLESAMPLAGTCSAAISAACHPPGGEDKEKAVLGRIGWGETINSPPWVTDEADESADQKGHCSFTSMEAMRPSPRKSYA